MKARLVGLFVALSASAGCGISDSESNLGTFTFELRDRPDSLSWTQVPIELIVRTEPQSPCLTHALKGDVGFGQDVVAVELASIKLPGDVCIPSDGPAEFSYPIGFGAVRVGNPFYLTFERDGDIERVTAADRYLVIVSDTMIDIAPLRATFTTPIARRVTRGRPLP
jgi:hypothetical protein